MESQGLRVSRLPIGKILINLGSARMIIGRLIQRSADTTQLTDLRILLNSLNLEVLKPDQTNFKNETTSLEKWNTAESELIDSSEKLAIELERQLSTSMRIGTMEYYSRRIEQRISKYKYT